MVICFHKNQLFFIPKYSHGFKYTVPLQKN